MVARHEAQTLPRSCFHPPKGSPLLQRIVSHKRTPEWPSLGPAGFSHLLLETDLLLHGASKGFEGLEQHWLCTLAARDMVLRKDTGPWYFSLGAVAGLWLGLSVVSFL